MSGELFFIEVLHTEGCIGHLDSGQSCTCRPSLRTHTDADYFLRSEARNRAQRRAAEREAARAMRKAGGRR